MQEQLKFSVKGHLMNILDFVGPAISVAAFHILHVSVKAATNKVHASEMAAFQ